MRTQDKRVFADAARTLNLWILVRRTNPASLQYIGVAGYTPKRIDCKAKTADQDSGAYRVAGLVVDAEIHERTFRPGKLQSAEKCWQEFVGEFIGKPGSPYAVDLNAKSPRYGCVTLNGKYIHGDYDLYDIIIPDQARRNLAAVETLLGKPHMRGPRLLQVQRFINQRIGVEMVQHGGEAQYADHSEQSIDVFGPQGEECTILNEFSVRGWYENQFGGRRTLGRG